MTAAVEGSWAEWLSVQGRHIEAVQHYTAAGRPEAAVEAAAAARNWEAASALLVAMVSLAAAVAVVACAQRMLLRHTCMLALC